MHPTEPGCVVSRRTWIATVAATVVAATVPMVARNAGTSSLPHPAVPCRMLDAQIDAAVREAVANAPAFARRAVGALATERFGSSLGLGVASVPDGVRSAVRSVLRRG